MRKALAILIAAGALAAIAYRQSRGLDDAAAPEAPTGTTWDALTSSMDDWTSLDYWTGHNAAETQANLEDAMSTISASQNVRAMLEAIAKCEGTTQAADPYRVCYAYRHTIQSYADHPAITGEWRGEKLSDALCKAAGQSAGCVSTAAGKYQITRTTWRNLKSKLSLADFSPASQDAAAVQLLRECGALALIERGELAAAVNAARRIWASLPGAGYAQPERSLSWVAAQYTAAGGYIA